MIHKDCGGKLTVIESFQQERKCLQIVRYRKCRKCGVILHSIEQIPGAVMEVGYKHRNYKPEDKYDKDRED